ncbi:MAG: type VI secretion system tip protein VgrG [Bacteroidota bacterium]
MASLLPTSSVSDRVTFKVKVDGNEINADFRISGLEIRNEINRVPFAIIELIDGDPANRDFPASNDDNFKPGAEVEIELGYDDNTESVFEGIIIKHKIKTGRKKSRLTIECKDKAVFMTQVRKSAYYYESLDSDVIETIIRDHGLSGDVEASSVSHKEIVKYNVTDWDFMVTRAELNSMIVIAGEGNITVKKPELSGGSVFSANYGENIYDFEAEMDARTQVSGTKGKSWDYANQEILEADGEEPRMANLGNVDGSELASSMNDQTYELVHSGKVEDQELAEWASARFLKSRLARIRGRVRVNGVAALKPGVLITLAGVGDRFSGDAFVSGVAHNIVKGKWFTDVQFGMSPNWFPEETEDVVDQPATGIIPGIGGLHVGVVTALEGDPDGENRIQVKIPLINNEEDGLWARIAKLDAGDNRGVIFLPEIDDEVIVGFINDDPRNPVILGQLHSSAKPSPIEPSDDNHEKGIITRGDLRVVFDDDKSSIEVSTPNGNKILLSEDDGSILVEDENGNTVKMSSDGVDVESAGDINIKASGDVNIEGTNVNVSAQSQLVCEGTTGAELSSGGQTVIKGALVAIN